MKLFESEVSSGNASGKAGIASLPFGKGYYSSGNSGEPGITFTPTGEPNYKTYKSMKHSKKNIKKKKMKHLKTFEMWTASSTIKNADINYKNNNDINFIDKPEPPKPPKPKEVKLSSLSKLGKDIIKYINHYFNYNTRITETEIEFNSDNKGDKPEIKRIKIIKNDNSYEAYFKKYVVPTDTDHYVDITENDYEYIKSYFQKHIKNYWDKINKEKEEAEKLKKIKDKKEIEERMLDPIKNRAKKYNL